MQAESTLQASFKQIKSKLKAFEKQDNSNLEVSSKQAKSKPKASSKQAFSATHSTLGQNKIPGCFEFIDTCVFVQYSWRQN